MDFSAQAIQTTASKKLPSHHVASSECITAARPAQSTHLCKSHKGNNKTEFASLEGVSGLGLLQFMVGNAINLPYRNNLFDLVIDKGTLDSVLKSENCGQVLAQGVFNECMRVLTPSGSLLMFTDEDPEIRIPLIEVFLQESFTRSTGASFSNVAFINGLEYFLYEIGKQ